MLNMFPSIWKRLVTVLQSFWCHYTFSFSTTFDHTSSWLCCFPFCTQSPPQHCGTGQEYKNINTNINTCLGLQLCFSKRSPPFFCLLHQTHPRTTLSHTTSVSFRRCLQPINIHLSETLSLYGAAWQTESSVSSSFCGWLVVVDL